jgi:hypothetical protein
MIADNSSDDRDIMPQGNASVWSKLLTHESLKNGILPSAWEGITHHNVALWPFCEVAADTEYVRLAVQTGSARAVAKTALLTQSCWPRGQGQRKEDCGSGTHYLSPWQPDPNETCVPSSGRA